jgi:NADP-dependent 3-hydroxy acid dehydrogenase YdfG
MSVESSLKNLFSLEGKVVMLTGAAGGIGAELARGMAGAGAAMADCDVQGNRLEELKDEFMLVVGHELRNPLQVILGRLQLLEMK